MIVSPLLQTLISIAREAAPPILDVYRSAFEVEYKGPGDPVTVADRVANEIICRRLKEAFPDVPVIAEENPPETWATGRKSDRIFFVDPLDGTREFVARTDDFVIMIGMVEGPFPKSGVLCAPVSGKIWAGTVGEGAWVIEQDRVTPLLDLSGRDLSDATVVSSKSRQTELHERALRALGARKVTPVGSAGLKGASIAEGTADIYLATEFGGCLWDTCAPEALIRAVGGSMTDAFGASLDYRAPRVENTRGTVAAAKGLHQQVIERLNAVFR